MYLLTSAELLWIYTDVSGRRSRPSSYVAVFVWVASSHFQLDLLSPYIYLPGQKLVKAICRPIHEI